MMSRFRLSTTGRRRWHALGLAAGALCLIALLASQVLASVELVDLYATAQRDNTIKVTWETGSEVGVFGFQLYRSILGPAGPWVAVGPIVPTNGFGGIYSYIDHDVVFDTTYWYLLESLEGGGVRVRYLDYIRHATLLRYIFLPWIAR